MLISQKIETKWNSKTKKYYENLGYTYTKMGDPLIVNVEDLKDYSRERVICQCDYCGREYSIEWGSYKHLKEKENNKDCCGDPKCTTQKSQESIMNKYGVQSALSLESTREKVKHTNLERYGCENPWSNDDIKNKIRKTNLAKYGSESPMKTQAVQDKARKTCLERYGYENYGALYSITHTKELSPKWKSDTEYQRDERTTIEYKEWRRAVFSRDHYTCQCCGDKSVPHNCVELQAHHILNWKDNADTRYDVDNGITLCEKCHMRFHSIYGKHCNTREQLDEFLNTTEKVC